MNNLVETEVPYSGPSIHNVLPAEVLTTMFHYLPPASLYSCMRSCRFMKNLIYTRRKRLQKNKLTLRIERTSEDVLSLKISKTSMHSPRKDWLCHLKQKETKSPQMNSERAVMSVAEFYDSYGLSGLKWNSANKSQTFYTDDVNLLPSELTMITSLIKDNCCTIEHIEVDSKSPMGLEQKLLLDEANTETVCLGFTEPTHFSPIMFESPTMRKAGTVILTVENREFGPRAVRPYETFDITDEMLLNLQADTFQTVGAYTKITEIGLKAFLKEWYGNKREINGIEILFPHVPLNFSFLVQGFKYVIKVKPNEPTEQGYILIQRATGESIKLMRHSNDVLAITETTEGPDEDFVMADVEDLEESDLEMDEDDEEEPDYEHNYILDGEANMLRNVVRDFDLV